MTKYERWYNQIIDRARNRVLGCYSERHHVRPRALGGGDEPENLVRLTYREHFLTHWLLTKFTGGVGRYKMLCALACMNGGNGRDNKPWRYEVRRRARKNKRHSEETKLKIGRGNKGKGRVVGTYQHSTETKLKIATKLTDNKNFAGKKLSPEHKVRLFAARDKSKKGCRISDWHKSRLLEGHRKYWEARRQP